MTTKQELIRLIQLGYVDTDKSLANIKHSIMSNMCPRTNSEICPQFAHGIGKSPCCQCWESALEVMPIDSLDEQLAKAQKLVETLEKAHKLMEELGGGGHETTSV